MQTQTLTKRQKNLMITQALKKHYKKNPPHNIDEIVEWMFGEEVEDKCDEESDIDQN